MKRTLKKELKEYEIVTRESNNAWLVLVLNYYNNYYYLNQSQNDDNNFN